MLFGSIFCVFDFGKLFLIFVVANHMFLQKKIFRMSNYVVFDKRNKLWAVFSLKNLFRDKEIQNLVL